MTVQPEINIKNCVSFFINVYKPCGFASVGIAASFISTENYNSMGLGSHNIHRLGLGHDFEAELFLV